MKPITLSEEMKTQMRDELLKQLVEKFDLDAMYKDVMSSLDRAKMSDGQFKFTKEFKYEKKFEFPKDAVQRTVEIRMTPDAYAKMITIIMANNDEVGWHGVSERISDTEFLIKDILLYPQKVTAATVDTDDEAYAKWLIGLDKIDENIFPNLHFHGHSHVNMSCSPSGVDMGHREKIISQLGPEDYYIFMIWNKRLEFTAAVYDVKTNTMYETDDVDVLVEFEDGTTAGDVVRDIDANVKKDVVTYKPSKTTSSPSTYSSKSEQKKGKTTGTPWYEEDDNGGYGAGNGSGYFYGAYNGYGGYNYGSGRYF